MMNGIMAVTIGGEGGRLNIGIIGDFQKERPSHQATEEALRHCAAYLKLDIAIEWLPTKALADRSAADLGLFDGFWCAPGEYESSEGAIRAIQYAREKGTSFIGTCQGFQHTVMEYAHNVLGLVNARHAEFEPGAENLIITALSCSFVGESKSVHIKKDSRVFGYYGAEESVERFTCNFGINPYYRKMIDDSGFKIAGTDETGEPRILDLTKNSFYIATLFQPQLTSTPEYPHKLILAFLKQGGG